MRADEPIVHGDSSRALVAWLRQQWKEVLHTDRADLEDNFFELGGDSLAALQIVGRLRQQGIDVEVTDVFENALLSEFAEHVSRLVGGSGLGTEFDAPLSKSDRGAVITASDLTLPPIVPAPDRRHEPFPLTDMQEAYWMGRSGLLELGRVDGHNYREYECSAELGRVEAAFQRLIERHDVLRAIIRPDGRQQILPEVPPYRIRCQDLRGRAAQDVEQEVARCRAEMTAGERPPDEWPPFEIRALALDGGRLRVHMRFEFMVYDARTQRMLLQEWAQLVTRPEAELPPLEVTFRDYVVALQGLKEHPVWQRAHDYWIDRAPRLPGKPELPRSRVRTERPTLKGLRAAMRLDRWLRLSNTAASSGLTLSTVLGAAFADTLAAWSSEERFLLTMMLLDRLPLHPQINDVIGNFSSTLLLEVDASPPTFAERARALQQRLSHDLRFRHFPAGQVLREINRLRAAPLAAASPFVFVSTLGVDRQFGSGTFWRYVRGSLSTPQILVDMRVAETDGLPAVRCEYVHEAFPDGLLPDLFDTYVARIERLADDPQSWNEQRRRITPPRHLEQRSAANATAAPLPEERLHAGFERHAEARAHQPAVISPAGRLTYRELDGRVEALAHRLTALGVRPGQLVAIVMEKGWEQVAAALAILRAGAAYVPINPKLPRDRRFHLFEICEIRIALTQLPLAQGLEWPAAVAERLVVTASADAAPPQRGAPRQGADDLAYVIFTSGSTGVPKGVMMGHRGAVNTLADVNRRFEVRADDRVLAVSALDFDLSVYDVFGLLGAGGAVVLPDGERIKDPSHWLDLLERERVTVWNSVPALLELLVDYAEASGRRLPDSLRLILLSGDWIPVGLPGRVQAMLPRARVISLGGATEAAVWSICYPIEQVDPGWTSIPYGKPLANQTMHVLDPRMEDRPVWVQGELYIGGAGVAQGYWRDEDKTRERFVVHPVTGERLYRTGDLGRYLPDGNIEFLGRSDSQVKVQGYRIELGEIESALALHPGVQLACATVRDGDRAAGMRATGYKRLVAYVVPAQHRRCTEAELVRHLRQKLPEYMVPHDVVLLDQLPLSPNGKVDRRALPEPVQPAASAPAGEASASPRTPIERKLAEIWSELLGRPVGVDRDFFDAGGDSVLAVQLVVRIARELGRELPVSALLAHPTIASMAPLLEQPAVAAPRRALVPLAPQGARDPLFLVHPIGGNVHCYLPLARLLAERGRPVYGFQARGADGTEAALGTVEEMASAYLDELRRHRPSGPYHLGGWSMGGVVALEMARRLQAAGERVRLVLIDAPARPQPVESEGQLLRRFGQDLVGARAAIGELPGAIPDGLARIVAIARGAGLELDLGGDRLARLFALFGAHSRALAAYAPAPYGGSACLFEADRDGTDTAGWPALVRGSLRRRRLPGSTHHTLLQDPSLSTIAGEIESLLEEV